MREAPVRLQCWWRQVVARRRVEAERRLENALLLEYWRGSDEAPPQYYYDLLAGAPTRRG